MSPSLISVGLLCIITAIVGGGVKAFGGEMPILASVKRQLLLGLFGVIVLLVAWASHPAPGGTGKPTAAATPVPAEAPAAAAHTVAEDQLLPLDSKGAKVGDPPAAASDAAQMKAEPLLNQAKADEAANLLAKAAFEYAEAYYSNGRTFLGMKAADIYANLQDYPDAAVVMRRLSYAKDSAVANEASQWLNSSQSGLAWTSKKLRQDGDALVSGDLLWKASSDTRQKALDDYTAAAKAVPQCSTDGSQKGLRCVWMDLARMQAFSGDVEEVKRTLGTAATWNLKIYPESFEYVREDGTWTYDGAWANLICDPSFVQFLGNVFGSDASDAANTVCHQIPGKS